VSQKYQISANISPAHPVTITHFININEFIETIRQPCWKIISWIIIAVVFPSNIHSNLIAVQNGGV